VLPLAEAPAASARQFKRHYSQTAVLGGSASPGEFRRSLLGISTGAADHIYVLGDDEVRVFDPLLRRVRGWRAPDHAACLAVGPDGRVYVGAPGRVDIFDGAGTRVSGFPTGEKDTPADVTAVRVIGADVLVADANARVIRRHGPDGTPRGLIGNLSKTGSFILPNRSLDIAVDTKGVVYATDTGRHQVTTWALDGTPLGKFGKFGMSAPEDFVGCCNPVNLALTPDGMVVTGEKMVARVKVFDPNGTLLAVIGPEHFDPSCIHIYLAVDSTGRILAADPARREVKVFSLSQPPRQGERA
jgi:sugar lactone lactonase YvrE